MRILLIVVQLVIAYTPLFAQTDTAIVALEKKFNTTNSIDEKLNLIVKIATAARMKQPELIEGYVDKALIAAEQSRDKNAIIKSKRIAALLTYQYSRKQNKYEIANKYAIDALQLSKQNNVSFKEKVQALNTISNTSMYLGKKSEALQYSQEALQIANESNVDSLKFVAYLENGNGLLYYDEKVKAFRSYLSAREIVEKTNDNSLKKKLPTINNALASFYSNVEDYDKSIDYLYKLYEHYSNEKDTEAQYYVLDRIGDNYTAAKNYISAISVYEKIGKLGDSTKNAEMKTSSKISILNAILISDDKQKGLPYLKQNPDIAELFIKRDYEYYLFFGLGNVYSTLKMYDSANYYYNKAIKPMLTKGDITQQMQFNYSYGIHLYNSNNVAKALDFLSIAKNQGDSLKSTDFQINVIEYLDSCYQKLCNYEKAYFYNSLRDKLKKEIDEKSKAKDLLMLEIETENKRAERLAAEQAEATQKRHNWQYMAIIISIFSLFSLLAVLGVFNVSIKWVKAIGFISFIFLFEFIILIADTRIHHATHGEPWKVLAIKVVLIAILMPLHHWLEHKAIHFILERRNTNKNLFNAQV